MKTAGGNLRGFESYSRRHNKLGNDMQVDYAEQILAAAEAEEEECKILIDRLDEMLANGDIDYI